MDTKLKKFKYSFFTKFLCWLIAMAAFLVSLSVAFDIAINCYVLGPQAYFKGEDVDFYETEGFKYKFQSDFYVCKNLASAAPIKFKQEVEKHKEEVCESVINEILDYKSAIIKAELEHAVNNWDTSYFEYQDTQDITLPSHYTTEVYVDEASPEQIQLAQKILVNAKGQEFLLFESLVRQEAFFSDYHYNRDLTEINDRMELDSAFSGDVSLSNTEKDIRAIVSKNYDSFVEAEADSRYGVDVASQRLKSVKNLKYYIIDLDGNVYKNISSIPKNLTNRDNYILINKDNYKYHGFEFLGLDDVFEGSNVNVLCIYFDDEFNQEDAYSKIYEAYCISSDSSVKRQSIALALSLVVFAAFLVICFKLLGKKTDGETRLAIIDKIPLDVLFVALGALGFAAVVCFHDIVNTTTDIFEGSLYTRDFKVLCLVIVFVEFVLLVTWISSAIRLTRVKRNALKSTLIFKVIHKLICALKSIYTKLKRVFAYKPKVFKSRMAIFIALFFIINIVSVFFIELFGTYAGAYAGAVIIIDIVLAVLYGFVFYLVFRFINNLDKIIVASEIQEKAELDEKAPASLVRLSDNLQSSNEALRVAVADAVKNEQMKTQLITNVSHDLKTPLTSIINYSDLLDKCNVEDEKAREYISVLNKQSIKLKRLIEDLIEASKVSTGNVQLNKTYLNLSELAVQTIVEYSPDFEANKNEIKLTEPENAPVVFADGIKTSRIISNLFSNAKKYSACGTRVYVSVYEDEEYGYFEIKNISNEPLNISPEMLTERFVRGEESRTNEGNGLGLSIAKDLCELQGGELVITIDGDLFKATVKLKKEE